MQRWDFGYTTSLGNLTGCEEEALFTTTWMLKTETPQGLFTLPKQLFDCLEAGSAQQPWRLDRAQADLSYKTMDGCMNGQRTRAVLSET